MTGSLLSIDICLCTFRRPQVADTLRSLAALDRIPDCAVRVIVADNDETPSARAIVMAQEAALNLPLTYVHAPSRNISIARNACLDNAKGDFVAFIDDDETASPGWLAALLAQALQSGADVVLGPVQAVYAPDAPAWMRRADCHATAPVWVGDEIVTGYSCNVLIRRTAPAVAGRRFRLSFGRTGGEDTAFFSEIHRAGGKITFAPRAVVTEPVPASRARFSWLMARRFRAGQTHGLLLAEEKGASLPARLRCIALASLKAGACLLAAPLDVRRWLLRGVLHAGAVSGLCGARAIEQYGTDGG